MRHVLVPLLILGLMLVIPVSVSDGDSTDVTVTGMVMMPDKLTNTPMEGVSVTIWSGVDVPTAHTTVKTSSDGTFTVTVARNYGDRLLLTYECDGYTVRSPGPSCLNSVTLDGSSLAYYVLDLYKAVGYSNGVYTISNQSNPVLMAVTASMVNGQVIYNNTGVKDATVTISNDAGDVYYTNTDASGSFSIQCPNGTGYTMTVECDGFITDTRIINVPLNRTEVIILTGSPGIEILGMDVPHLMMAIVVVLSLLVTVTVASVAHSNSKNIVVPDEKKND